MSPPCYNVAKGSLQEAKQMGLPAFDFQFLQNCEQK
jgi:hypothetical protein